MTCLTTLMLERHIHKLGKAKFDSLIERGAIMYFLKYIGSFIWTFCTFGVVYAILRMMTGVSKTDFSGSGTKLYIALTILYLLVTIGIGVLVSKKWLYFLAVFIILCILSPLILILILNHTNILK